VKVNCCFGRAVALALLSVSVASCGNNPLSHDPKTIDASALGGKDDPQVRAFYAARNGQAAWDGKSRKALIAILDDAPVHGLKRDLFLKGDLPKDATERDVALTGAALRYASALAEGYADPKKLGRIYTVPRNKVDVAAGLSKALANGQLAQWYQSLVPQTEEYRALSDEFVRYLKLANRIGDTPPIGDGKAIKPGRSDGRISAIASALTINGYLPQQPPAGRQYSPAMVAAIKRVQADYGIKPDGVIGPSTIDALEKGPGDRARQLAVNLERLRWLDRNPPETRIDVNTGGAFLEYWRDGSLRDRRRVVVGQPDWETPQLGSPLFQLVAHPYWRVPDSILNDELKDKSQAYFAEQNMEYRDGRLVQLPGPKNSLGEVKFDLRNDQAIYLHDTPAKALFATDERHRSHGCVRVYDALGFAMLIAQDEGVAAPFQEAMTKVDDQGHPQEGYVKLQREIPVRLMYRTAFLDNGKVKLVNDIYGWDDDVAYALGYVRRPPRAKQAHEGGDVGP
jgi:murein L,D-transpeptidase YcbB/YkuD